MIMVKNINKFFPELDETQKDHMRQTKQGVCSTKVQQLVEEVLPETPLLKERDTMVKILEMRELTATDQTGKFPVTSSWGSKYIMVMAEIVGNAVLVATMKRKTEEEIIKAYLSLLQGLKMRELSQSIRFSIMKLQTSTTRQSGTMC